MELWSILTGSPSEEDVYGLVTDVTVEMAQSRREGRVMSYD
jgi:hypothetical protein